MNPVLDCRVGQGVDPHLVLEENACLLLETRLLLRKVEDHHRRRPDPLAPCGPPKGGGPPPPKPEPPGPPAPVAFQKKEDHLRQSLARLANVGLQKGDDRLRRSHGLHSLDRLAQVRPQRKEDLLDRPGRLEEKNVRTTWPAWTTRTTWWLKVAPSWKLWLAKIALAESFGVAKA